MISKLGKENNVVVEQDRPMRRGRKVKNEAGKTYGKLKVISCAGKDKHGHVTWNCTCSCGKKTTVRGTDLRAGRVVSCGCSRGRAIKHGLCRTPEYHIWQSIKSRCNNKNHPAYHNYGGRGCVVFAGWLKDFKAFTFYCRQHGFRPGLQIDLIDKQGSYVPGNIAFVDKVSFVDQPRPCIFKDHRTYRFQGWSLCPDCEVLTKHDANNELEIINKNEFLKRFSRRQRLEMTVELDNFISKKVNVFSGEKKFKKSLQNA